MNNSPLYDPRHHPDLVAHNPLSAMKNIDDILVRLDPRDRSRVGVAMDLCAAWGALVGWHGVAPGSKPDDVLATHRALIARAGMMKKLAGERGG